MRTGSHGEARQNPRAYDLVQSRQVRLHIAQLYRLHSAPDIHADEARRDAVRYRHCCSDDALRSSVRVRYDADMRVARELLTTQLQNLRLRRCPAVGGGSKKHSSGSNSKKTVMLVTAPRQVVYLGSNLIMKKGGGK